MNLKYKIDSLDGLDENLAALYEKDGDGYRLKVDGIPQGEDVSGLKAKVEELLAEKKAAAQKAREAEEAARRAAEEAARKNGDIEALEKSWREKLERREKELLGKINELESGITAMTVDTVAAKLANELAVQGSADVLLPHIKARLAVEQRDGKYVTVVRDAEGKPSAATIDDLKNEFSSNPAFAPVIAGSRATGGGASGSAGGGASKKFSELSERERVELYRRNPEEYRRLRDAEK